MLLKLGFGLVLCLVAMTAVAATTREKLVAPGNVPFGLGFTATRPSSLANFETDVDGDNNNILLGEAEIFGLPFAVNYTFGKKNTLSKVYAIADGQTGDYAVCRERWNGVKIAFEGAYGAADKSSENFVSAIQSARFEFAFKDGGKIEGSILGCLIMVTYSAAA